MKNKYCLSLLFMLLFSFPYIVVAQDTIDTIQESKTKLRSKASFYFSGGIRLELPYDIDKEYIFQFKFYKPIYKNIEFGLYSAFYFRDYVLEDLNSITGFSIGPGLKYNIFNNVFGKEIFLHSAWLLVDAEDQGFQGKLTYGIGFEYNVSKRVKLIGSYDRFFLSEPNFHTISVGIKILNPLLKRTDKIYW